MPRNLVLFDLEWNIGYQEVYNSQTQGGGDFDKQGGEQ